MKRLCFIFTAIGLFLLFAPRLALAQYTSSNYQSNEVYFGAGGDTSQSSANYQGSASLGALGVGQNSSPAYQAYLGFLTPNEPFLSMQILTSTVNLGTLDSASTKTGTASFQVRCYVNSGYVVYTMNDPPALPNGTKLTGMASQGSSVVGTDQYGINLRANTSPTTFGADPSPQPDSTFAFGKAASGYDIANQFKYVKGDAIANTSTSGWGQTNFTISFIANTTPLKPAGNYSTVEDLVVVPTF